MWNKIFNSKLVLVLIAVLFAVAFWLYVDIVEQPDATETYHNIPVTFLGEETLAEEGLMIIAGKDITVDLVVEGPRSSITKINKSDIKITVQAASQISGEGNYSLTFYESLPSIVSGTGVRIIDRSVSEIDVTVVQMITRTFEIQGRFTGSVVEHAHFDESEFQFEVPTITVSGERSIVQQIDRAVVTLAEEELSTTWTGELPIVLLDEQGNEVTPSNLTMDVESVFTRFPVQLQKEVTLEVSFLSGGAATKDNVTYEIEPKSIRISGTEEQLEKIDSINIGTIDLSKIITSEVLSFNIPVPDGVSIISNNGVAKVSLSVTGLSTRMIETSNIQLINVPDDADVELLTKSMSVRIRGDEATMALVVESDILVTVDLDGIDFSVTGSRTVPAKVSVVGFADVGAVSEYHVVIDVS